MPATESVLTVVPEAEAAPVLPAADQAAKAIRAARSFHETLLILALLVLTLAVALQVRGERQVTVPLVGMPLPELCYWHRLFGVDCPGCGLTRCFISLAHGDLARAWHFHPAGILLFAGLAFQVPYRSAQLWRLRRGRGEYEVPGWRYLAWLVILLMAGQWIWRVLV